MMSENERDRFIILEEKMETLFGKEQPGIIQKIQDKQETLSRVLYIGLGIIGTLQFLAANGWLKIH